MTKGKVIGVCLLGLLAYGYFIYLPKRFITANTAKILACAGNQENFSYLGCADVTLDSPAPELNRYKLNQMTFSVLMKADDVQTKMLYITVKPSIHVTSNSISQEWNILNVSSLPGGTE